MSQVFFMPTRVFEGPDCLKTHAAALAALGKKALVVTGRKSAQVTGAGADVEAALKSQGIAYAVFDQIPPNPGFEEIRQAAALARKEGADFIIGIGGGSPLDAAKAIAVLAANDLDDEKIFQPPFPQNPLPVAAVPTTAGTGSEVTQYSILTNDKLQTKTSIAHESIFPKIAFLDAKYTLALPRHVTVNTALDALSHLVESFLSVRATAVSQNLALQGLAQLGPALQALADHPQANPSLELRRNLLLASTTAGMVIAQTGTTAGHALGYSLTYFKDIDHGRANALTMADYLDFLSRKQQEKLVSQVYRALGTPQADQFRKLLDNLLGKKEKLTADEIRKFAGLAIQARNIANTLGNPTEGDLAGILEKSLG